MDDSYLVEYPYNQRAGGLQKTVENGRLKRKVYGQCLSIMQQRRILVVCIDKRAYSFSGIGPEEAVSKETSCHASFEA